MGNGNHDLMAGDRPDADNHFRTRAINFGGNRLCPPGLVGNTRRWRRPCRAAQGLMWISDRKWSPMTELRTEDIQNLRRQIGQKEKLENKIALLYVEVHSTRTLKNPIWIGYQITGTCREHLHASKGDFCLSASSLTQQSSRETFRDV